MGAGVDEVKSDTGLVPFFPAQNGTAKPGITLEVSSKQWPKPMAGERPPHIWQSVPERAGAGSPAGGWLGPGSPASTAAGAGRPGQVRSKGSASQAGEPQDSRAPSYPIWEHPAARLGAGRARSRPLGRQGSAGFSPSAWGARARERARAGFTGAENEALVLPHQPRGVVGGGCTENGAVTPLSLVPFPLLPNSAGFWEQQNNFSIYREVTDGKLR